MLRGGCHCGKLAVALATSRPAAEMHPRACDCSFCRKHGAAWLSDARGSLRLRTRGDALVCRQGSAQAEFLCCPHCAVLVMVTCAIEGRLHGAVNVRTLDDAAGFAMEQPASPQRLPAQEKIERWSQLWFADVHIVDVES